MNPINEPVGYGGLLTAFSVALIPFLRAFGIYDMTEDQTGAFLGLLAAAIAIGTFVVRSRVTPTQKADRKITEAYFADPAKDALPTLAKVG